MHALAAKIQNDLRILTERLARINDNLARKVTSRTEYDKTITEVRARARAYYTLFPPLLSLMHCAPCGRLATTLWWRARTAERAAVDTHTRAHASVRAVPSAQPANWWTYGHSLMARLWLLWSRVCLSCGVRACAWRQTEAAYAKIMESSQTLLHVLKRESVNLTKKKQASS